MLFMFRLDGMRERGEWDRYKQGGSRKKKWAVLYILQDAMSQVFYKLMSHEHTDGICVVHDRHIIFALL